MSLDPDSNHRELRNVLRVVGPLVFSLGLILMGVGIASFFQSFNAPPFSRGPDKFWMAFIGMPIMGVGGMICNFAYMGAVSRYVANETAPVGTDTFNYVAKGTKDSVRDVAEAIGDGLSQAGGSAESERVVVRCHKCNATNDEESKFCNQCGVVLHKSVKCQTCDELNDPDARFCDNCGTKMR